MWQLFLVDSFEEDEYVDELLEYFMRILVCL